MAIGGRQCSVNDVCNSIRQTEPTQWLLDDTVDLELPPVPTVAASPFGRARRGLFDKIFGRLGRQRSSK
jgi:hypothetical protein